MNSIMRQRLFWLLLLLAVVLIGSASSQFGAGESPLSFSEFIRLVDTGQVDRVEITGNEIVGTSLSGEPFRTYAPEQYEGLANRLIERDVAIQAKSAAPSTLLTFLYGWAPMLLIVGFFLFYMRQAQSGGNTAMSFGKSRAKQSPTTQKKRRSRTSPA